MLRTLCDPPEAEGYGKSLRSVQDMTLYQLAGFSVDKSSLKPKTANSFRQAKAMIEEARKSKDGNQVR